MPELPEVETIRRQLDPELRNRRIERLEVLDARWTRPVDPRKVEEQVNGRRIESLRRRGKYLLMDLEGGVTLVMHLRMTGNLLLVDEGDLVAAVDESTFERGERYLRARFSLDEGRELWFSDARRFGEAFVLATDRVEERFAGRVGIEPFSEQFTAEAARIGLTDRVAMLPSITILRSARALRFIDQKVPGISVPAAIIERVEAAPDQQEACFDVAYELAQHAMAQPGVRGLHFISFRKDAGIAALCRRLGIPTHAERVEHGYGSPVPV